MQEYEKLKASDPDFYRAADSMSYGGAGKVPDANIDKMVAELNERCPLLLSLVDTQWLHMGQASPGSSEQVYQRACAEWSLTVSLYARITMHCMDTACTVASAPCMPSI